MSFVPLSNEGRGSFKKGVFEDGWDDYWFLWC